MNLMYYSAVVAIYVYVKNVSDIMKVINVLYVKILTRILE